MAPYKSDAQRKYFHSSGKVPSSVVKEYDKSSKGKKTPEYVSTTRFAKLKKKLKGNK